MGRRQTHSAARALAAIALLCAGEAAQAGSGAPRMILRWEPVPQAVTYELEIARDRGFKDVVLHESVAVPLYRWSAPSPAPYFWRVRSIDAQGRKGDWSKPERFGLPPPPPPAPPSPPKPPLSAHPPPPPPKRPPATSEVRTFSQQALSPLQAPATQSPAPGEVIADSSAPLTLSWTEVPEAARYELSLSAPDALESVELRKSSAPQLRLEQLPAGDYAWRVRALDAKGIPGPWSPAARFFLGLPPSARAEIQPTRPSLVADGKSATELHIRLFDAQGRGVHGAPVTVTCTAGVIEGVVEREGEYTARYVAPHSVPEGGSAWVVVKDRGFEATATLPLSAPAGPRLRAGARAGWHSNFGFLSSPLVEVDVAYRTPLLGSRLQASARFGFYGASRTLSYPDGTSENTTAQVGRLALVAAYVQELGAFSVYSGLGPALQLARVELGPRSETQSVPGAEGVLGAGRALGPGELTLEVSYTLGTLNSELVRLRTGGLSLTVGYQVALF